MNPSPIEETFAGKDGIELFASIWQPEVAPRALAVLVHGFLSHSGYLAWPAAQLAGRGFAAYTCDLRGHGRSAGDRYWVDHYTDYVEDLEAFIALAQSREPGLPTFLLGHSAGGVVATLYAKRHSDRLRGLVCESFAFEVPPPQFVLQALKGVAELIPHAPLLKLHERDFSRDPAVVERMMHDPLINHKPGPAHTLAELIRAHDELGQGFGEITAPVLILHGTADKATRCHGSQRFYDETGSRDKTLKLYQGHYHDLLNDLGREEVMREIVDWVEARVGA